MSLSLFDSLLPSQRRVHLNAVRICSTYLNLEIQILAVLNEVERENIHKLLGYSSLYNYAVSELKLSEWSAHYFIAVARACREIEPLRQAVREGTITVSKAARMMSTLTKDNAEKFVEFAKVHSSREIDREAARLNPKGRVKDKIKPVAGDWFSMECGLSEKVLNKLKRAQALESNKLGRAADINDTLDAALELYLQKHDPVVKADRAQAKKVTRELKIGEPRRPDVCSSRRSEVSESSSNGDPGQGDSNVCSSRKRVPLSAAQKHAVHQRDRGRCTFVHHASGERCSNERWTEIHHILGVAEGGGNEPANLSTLCAPHHDLVHQLSLPFEHQVTWLRSPHADYFRRLSSSHEGAVAFAGAIR